MHTISESEGIVRLTTEEREAIAKVLASTRNFNVAHGFRIAALLHQGKTRAAEMAGVMHDVFRESIDDAARIINDGDLERGRLLAERNFVEGDMIAADEAVAYGNLNELYAAVKRLDRPDAFAPLSKEVVGGMSDSDLSMWGGALSASLDAVLNEQLSRRSEQAKQHEPMPAPAEELVDAVLARTKSVTRKARKAAKKRTTPKAIKSQRRRAQAAKKRK